jgi:hypothetical protein
MDSKIMDVIKNYNMAAQPFVGLQVTSRELATTTKKRDSKEKFPAGIVCQQG